MQFGEVFLLGLAGRGYQQSAEAELVQVHKGCIAAAAHDHSRAQQGIRQFLGVQVACASHAAFAHILLAIGFAHHQQVFAFHRAQLFQELLFEQGSLWLRAAHHRYDGVTSRAVIA